MYELKWSVTSNKRVKRAGNILSNGGQFPTAAIFGIVGHFRPVQAQYFIIIIIIRVAFVVTYIRNI